MPKQEQSHKLHAICEPIVGRIKVDKRIHSRHTEVTMVELRDTGSNQLVTLITLKMKLALGNLFLYEDGKSHNAFVQLLHSAVLLSQEGVFKFMKGVPLILASDEIWHLFVDDFNHHIQLKKYEFEYYKIATENVDAYKKLLN